MAVIIIYMIEGATDYYYVFILLYKMYYKMQYRIMICKK